MKLLAVFIWKWLMFWINRKQTVKMVWDCMLGAFLLSCLFKGSSYWDIVKWTISQALHLFVVKRDMKKSIWFLWKEPGGNNLCSCPVWSHQQIGTVVMPIILFWIWLLSVDSQMGKSEIDSMSELCSRVHLTTLTDTLKTYWKMY